MFEKQFIIAGDMAVNFSRPFFHPQQSQVRMFDRTKECSAPSQPQHTRTSSESSSPAQSDITMIGSGPLCESPKEVEDGEKGLVEPASDFHMSQTTRECLSEAKADKQITLAEDIEETAVSGEAAAGTADTEAIAKESPSTQTKMKRYYSYALAEEDKTALAVGELNHNLREWTPEGVRQFHDSRLDLIHPGPPGQKETIAQIMDEREKSEKTMGSTKRVSYMRRSLFRRNTVGNAYWTSNVNLRQAFQSTQDVRRSSAPVLPAPGSPMSPQSSISQTSTPTLIFTPAEGDGALAEEDEDDEDTQLAQVPGRTYDYFAHPTSRKPSSASSQAQRSAGDRVSAYIASPLRPHATPYRVPNHRPRPDRTFEAFLVPDLTYKSGRALTLSESEIAEPVAAGEEGRTGGKRRHRLLRHVVRIASLPDLRKRNMDGNDNKG
jgi:hypothetical protein